MPEFTPTEKGITPATNVVQQAINTSRTLCMDAVQQANSGHPGTPMAMAPVICALWQKFLRFDPEDPIWPKRDRFVGLTGTSIGMNIFGASALLKELQRRFGFTVEHVVETALNQVGRR